MLKAFVMNLFKIRSLTTHNITELIMKVSQKIKVPADLLSKARYLTPHYMISRYPDAAAGVPYQNYDENISKTCIEYPEDILKWAKNNLKD